jgi:uncharacterized protein YbbC (DUF1343 family)
MNFSNNTLLLMMIAKNNLRLLLLSFIFSCSGLAQHEHDVKAPAHPELSALPVEKFEVGAERVGVYIERLQGKRIAVVANHTSFIGDQHLVDSLLSLGVDISHVYAPEHGFRGDRDAGAIINDEIDLTTGLPIISLHGKVKKPTLSSLNGIDLVLFDIQDVGVRFYTYISTLHYIMEACAEADIPLMILDRPNPNNGYKPDGPILDPAFSSFIGMHPVPVLYRLTIGEYGLMINGQGWLADGVEVNVTVIACAGYTRDMDYELPIPPSPNLPNQKSIYLYPSLCFFEGTVVSVGRGTDYPFQVVGHPAKSGSYSFVPKPNSGSKHPKLQGEECIGVALSDEQALMMREQSHLDLSLLFEFYNELDLGDDFFREDGFFDLLAGTDLLRKQIQSGMSEAEIRATWDEGLRAYEKMWSLYRLYE